MNNNSVKLGLSLLLVAVCTLQSLAAFTGNRTSPLGINTNETMDMDSSVPFINLFKLALPFEEARPWLTKGKVEYDKHGWPKNLNGGQAGTRFLYKLPENTLR